MNSKLQFLLQQYQSQKENPSFQMVQFDHDAFFINAKLNDTLEALSIKLNQMSHKNYQNHLDLLHTIEQAYHLNQDLKTLTKQLFEVDIGLHEDLILYYENLIEKSKVIIDETKNLNPYLLIIEDYFLNLYHLYLLTNKQLFMDHYPFLKDYQINYYLSHHTPGIYYSIEDFKEHTKTSYETSRQSMDYFVELHIYKKRKIGKKYVYTSILTL